MKILSEITEIIDRFQPITLEEMDGVKLMNRVDAKYVMNAERMKRVLEEAALNYRVLEIENQRLLQYKTVYFDTPEYTMFNAHQNGKLNRYKIRQREYCVSGIHYLEVKFKTNKGKTEKKRIKVKGNPGKWEKKSTAFISERTPFDLTKLEQKLWNTFKRITLVHKTDQERITLDFDLTFRNELDQTMDVPYLCIAEIKRERLSISSDFIQLLRKNKIRDLRISKYCIGSVLLNKDLKYNNFKEKLMTINKLKNDYTINTFAAVS